MIPPELTGTSNYGREKRQGNENIVYAGQGYYCELCLIPSSLVGQSVSEFNKIVPIFISFPSIFKVRIN